MTENNPISVQKKPPGRLSGLRWPPVLIALTCALLIGSVQFFTLISTPFAKSHDFTGALSRKNKLVPITVPDGARILAVLVQEGAHINVGQTVALLDPLPYDTELQSLARSMFGLRAELKCLRNISELKDLTQILPDPSPDDAASLEDQAELSTLAMDQCRLKQQQRAIALSAATDRIATLQERLRLVDRSLGFAGRFALPADGAEGPRNTEQLRQSLALSLAKNLATEELQHARQNFRTLILTQEDARLSNLQNMSEILFAQSARQVELGRATSNLRLYAAVAGTAKDLRKKSVGSVFYNGDALMEIMPSGAPDYEVEFVLPARLIDQIPLGTRVQLNVKGLTQKPPILIGHIKRYSYRAASGPRSYQIIGHISLTDSAITALRDTSFGLARMSGNVAMAVDIKILQDNLWTTAQATVLNQGNVRQLLDRIAWLIFMVWPAA